MHEIIHPAKASKSKTKKATPDVQHVNYWKPKMKRKIFKAAEKKFPITFKLMANFSSETLKVRINGKISLKC